MATTQCQWFCGVPLWITPICVCLWWYSLAKSSYCESSCRCIRPLYIMVGLPPWVSESKLENKSSSLDFLYTKHIHVFHTASTARSIQFTSKGDSKHDSQIYVKVSQRCRWDYSWGLAFVLSHLKERLGKFLQKTPVMAGPIPFPYFNGFLWEIRMGMEVPLFNWEFVEKFLKRQPDFGILNLTSMASTLSPFGGVVLICWFFSLSR